MSPTKCMEASSPHAQVETSTAHDLTTTMYGLLVKTLQPPTAVQSAVVGYFTRPKSDQQAPELLVNRQNSVQLWRTVPQQSELSPVAEFCVHEYVHRLVRIEGPEGELDALLLFASDDSVTLVQWDGERFKPSGLLVPETLCPDDQKDGQEGPHPRARRVDGIRVGKPTPLGKVGGSEEEIWRVSVGVEAYYGWVHILQVEWRRSVTWSLTVSSIHLGDVCRDAWREAIRTLDLEFCLGGLPGGEHLAVLLVDDSQAEKAISLDIFALWKSGTLLVMKMRNLCPTTTLLMATDRLFPEQKGQKVLDGKSGLILVSSVAVKLLHYPEESSKDKGAISTACSWILKGIPLCIEPIDTGRCIVGDSLGGLTIVHFGTEATWFPVDTQGLSSVPSCLAYVEDPSEEFLGLLFAGSQTGDSQILGIPVESAVSSKPSGTSTRWTMIQAVAIDNAGPVHDMVAVEGLSGIPDKQLLLCCGEYPTGSLRKACFGMGVESVTVNGPSIQEGVRLMSVKARSTDEFCSYLIFSYDSVSRTDVMSIADLHFRPTTIPGFSHDSNTLLVTLLSEDAFLQVTPTEVMVISVATSEPITWSSSETLTLASFQASTLVLARGSMVLCLDVSSKYITLKSERQMSQQVSAVHVYMTSLPHPFGELVAIGQWVSNRILLVSAPSLKDICETELVGYQPRSFGFISIKDIGLCMVVGTSTGEAGLIEVIPDEVGFRDAKMVEVGRTGVEIGTAGDWDIEGDCVVAACDQACIIHSTTSSSTNLLDCVEATRLYLGEGCTTLTPIYSASIARGIAWTSVSNQLVFGSLCPKLKLRWMSARIGETPHHAAYHSTSQCFIVLTEQPGNVQSIHLVDPASLKPLTSLRLDSTHFHCGVMVAALPCSSSFSDDNGVLCANDQPWKEFVVIWSYVLMQEGCENSLEACQGLISILEISFENKQNVLQFTLKCHGSIALPKVPHSCAVMASCASSMEFLHTVNEGAQCKKQPEFTDSVLQFADLECTELQWDASWPIILIGSENGVTAHRIVVDDSGVLGAEAAKKVLNHVQGFGELSLPVSDWPIKDDEECELIDLLKKFEASDNESDEKKLMVSMKKALFADWSKKLFSAVVGSAQAFSKAPVVALATMEGLIIASEFLGSVTLFMGDFVTRGDKDRHPLWAPLIPLSVDKKAVCVQAVIPLSKSMFLVSVHPFGFMVLHHDMKAMEHQVAHWREELVKYYEQGKVTNVPVDRGGQHEQSGEDFNVDGTWTSPPESIVEQMQRLDPLMIGASCRIPQVVGGFCRGCLGMRVQDAKETEEEEGDLGKGSQVSSSSEECILYYAGSGSIGMCRVISQKEAEDLGMLQAQLHEIQRQEKLCPVSRHHHKSMFVWPEDNSDGVVVSIDGNFITRGLEEIDVDAAMEQQLRRLCTPTFLSFSRTKS